MSNIMTILMFIAMATVLAALVMGLVTMLRPPSPEQAVRSNKLMQWRVILQALAIIFFVLAVFFSKTK